MSEVTGVGVRVTYTELYLLRDVEWSCSLFILYLSITTENLWKKTQLEFVRFPSSSVGSSGT